MKIDSSAVLVMLVTADLVNLAPTFKHWKNIELSKRKEERKMAVYNDSYNNDDDYRADLAWEYRKGGPNDPESNYTNDSNESIAEWLPADIDGKAYGFICSNCEHWEAKGKPECPLCGSFMTNGGDQT